MTVAAVIPNFNGASRLKKLLPQLQGRIEAVLVVDNGSSDDSVAVARAHDATVVQLDRNYGFARAVNAGIREVPAGTEWVAILNNDVTLQTGFFESLTTAARGAWFAAPKILSANAPGVIDATYDLPTRSGAAYRRGAGLPDGPEFSDPREITCAPMTAAIFRRELFDRVGLLDETFGSYLEDVEFGIRCALAGCKGVYVPQAVAYHEGSATLGGSWSSGTTYWISRNQVLLARKYAVGVWPALWGQFLWGLLALKHGVFAAWCKGKLDGLRPAIQKKCHQNLFRIVVDSERQIEDLQRRTGWDWYWRQYFRFLPLDQERDV
jgi:GT2 family glycosyltransferase